MSLPVFAGISLAFAPLKQNEVAQSLAAGEDSVTDVVGGSAAPVALPSTVLGRPPARGRFVGEPGRQRHAADYGARCAAQAQRLPHLGEPDELDPKILTIRCT